MNSKSRSRKLDKEEMTYSSEVKGSLGLRALWVMALVVGLVAALSAERSKKGGHRQMLPSPQRQNHLHP